MREKGIDNSTAADRAELTILRPTDARRQSASFPPVDVTARSSPALRPLPFLGTGRDRGVRDRAGTSDRTGRRPNCGRARRRQCQGRRRGKSGERNDSARRTVGSAARWRPLGFPGVSRQNNRSRCGTRRWTRNMSPSRLFAAATTVAVAMATRDTAGPPSAT